MARSPSLQRDADGVRPALPASTEIAVHRRRDVLLAHAERALHRRVIVRLVLALAPGGDERRVDGRLALERDERLAREVHVDPLFAGAEALGEGPGLGVRALDRLHPTLDLLVDVLHQNNLKKIIGKN